VDGWYGGIEPAGNTTASQQNRRRTHPLPTLTLLAIQVLQFRAYRLIAPGLTRLATLPDLCALSCHGLDSCLDAATAACFATSRTLQQLVWCCRMLATPRPINEAPAEHIPHHYLSTFSPSPQVLEFRASRLTAPSLTRLATLPALCALSCHGLDSCLDAATAACFATSRTLQQLHLGCDYEVPDEALQQLRDVAGGLSMCFRWGRAGAVVVLTIGGGCMHTHMHACMVCLWQ
jgi:hypothetical protein